MRNLRLSIEATACIRMADRWSVTIGTVPHPSNARIIAVHLQHLVLGAHSRPGGVQSPISGISNFVTVVATAPIQRAAIGATCLERRILSTRPRARSAPWADSQYINGVAPKLQRRNSWRWSGSHKFLQATVIIERRRAVSAPSLSCRRAVACHAPRRTWWPACLAEAFGKKVGQR